MIRLRYSEGSNIAFSLVNTGLLVQWLVSPSGTEFSFVHLWLHQRIVTGWLHCREKWSIIQYDNRKWGCKILPGIVNNKSGLSSLLKSPLEFFELLSKIQKSTKRSGSRSQYSLWNAQFCEFRAVYCRLKPWWNSQRGKRSSCESTDREPTHRG